LPQRSPLLPRRSPSTTTDAITAFDRIRRFNLHRKAHAVTTSTANSIGDLVVSIRAAGKASRLAFLLGAGVSIPTPTELPSGPALRDLAVRALFDGLEWNGYRDVLLESPRYERLLPERAFQALFVAMQESLFHFFEVLGSALPNEVHRVVAAAQVEWGSTLLTTNFDLCLEDPRSGATDVVHLHGALGDLQTLIVRIHQVGRGLDPDLRRASDDRLRNRVVVVLGYSGADRDIRQLLEDSDAAEILWLVRTAREDRTLGYVRSLGSRHVVHIFYGDLNDLAAALGNSLSPRSRAQDLRKTNHSYSAIAQRWADALTREQRQLAIVKLLAEVDEEQSCIDAALAAAHETVGASRARFYLDAATGYNRIGDASSGLDLIREAETLAAESDDLGVLAQALNVRGLLLMEARSPRYAEARRVFAEALGAARRFRRSKGLTSQQRENVVVLLGRISNNLGLASAPSDKDEAGYWYRRALRYKTEVGDRVGEAITCANLCHLYAAEGEDRRSTYWESRARVAMDEYNLDYQRGFLFRQLASIRLAQGRVAAARDFVTRARSSYSSVPDVPFDLELVKSLEEEIEAAERRS
jgi:hypothetical protein